MSGRDRELLRKIRADQWIDEAVREEAVEGVRNEISAGSRASSTSDSSTIAARQEYLSSVRRKSTTNQKSRPAPTKPPSATHRNNDSGIGGFVAFIIISAFLWFCGVTIYKVFAYSDVQGAFDKASLLIECAMSPTCTKIPQSRR